MDCQTILSNAKMVKYTNVRDMIADVRQMFKNCVIYNEDGSDIFKMGKSNMPNLSLQFIANQLIDICNSFTSLDNFLQLLLLLTHSKLECFVHNLQNYALMKTHRLIEDDNSKHN